MPQRYIISHTSIRGIAALLVVFYHMQFGSEIQFSWEQATPFFKKGFLWVDLFFILSGFVISYSARAEERAPFSPKQLKTFYVSRIARIYPLHVFALFMLLGVLLFQYAASRFGGIGEADPQFLTVRNFSGFLEQLFLLNVWGPSGVGGWNIPSWSISAEMGAYIVFPLAAAAVALARWPSLVAIVIGAIAFYVWIGLTTGDLDITRHVAILRCFSGFGLGMVIYVLRAKVEHWPTTVLGVLQAVGVLIVAIVMAGGFNDVLVIPGFFLLVAATWPDRGWLATVLKARPLHWLGEISYSVYLNHFWILAGWHFVADRALRAIGLAPIPARAVILFGGLVLVLAISHVTYLFVEKPARRAIVQRFSGRKEEKPASGLPAGNELT